MNNIISFNNYDKEYFKSLPCDGWIKPCYSCNIPTSKYKLIEYSHDSIIKIYLCKCCIQNTTDDSIIDHIKIL